jgi:hypothetical protein
MLDNTKLSIDPSNERQEYDDLIAEKFENWGDEDEKRVQAEWVRSEAKSLCQARAFTQRTALLTTWKISLRLYRQAPVTIFSERFDLRYQAVDTNGQASELLYSGTFCSKLSEIMVHPCWEQDVGLLALGLRWTAMCRMDDRRLWPFVDTYGCPVLEALDKQIREHDEQDPDSELPSSYHDIHEELRLQALDDRRLPSYISNLLHKIGDRMADEESLRPTSDDADKEYDGYLVVPVTLWDLKVLSEAINATELREEWNYSTGEALKAWNALQTGKIASKDKLPLLYELSYKNLFRHRIVQEREELQSTTGSDSGSSGDDQVALTRHRGSRQVLSDSDDQGNEPVHTRTHSRNGPTLSQAMPQIPHAPAYDSPSYQDLLGRVRQLESDKGRLLGVVRGQKEVIEAFEAKLNRLDGKISSLPSALDKRLEKMFDKLLQALQTGNPGLDQSALPLTSVLDSVVSRAASESGFEPVGNLDPEPTPPPEPEPMEEVPVPDSRTVPETSEKQALPAVGQTPDPALPVVDHTDTGDDVETGNVSSIPGSNAETRVKWTIPGMPRDSVRSLRKLQLPVRRFGSRVGNASMRNNRLHIVRRTLQAKKSKWLSEVCKDMTKS